LEPVQETFQSGGQAVPVDIFQSPEGKHPAVILLHGADGLSLHPESYRRFARLLAENHYQVYLVHYFEVANIKTADRQAMRKYFLQWGQVIDDAIAFAIQKPNVLPECVGLLGISLGATLALSFAAVRPGVRAVVEFFGGLPDEVAPLMKTMPPVLIVHGAKDRRVPIEEATKLESLLKEKEVLYQIKVYEEEGHFFGSTAAKDAARLAIDFFDEHLRPLDPTN